MNNNILIFNQIYYNEDNKNIIKNLFLKEDINQNDVLLFDNALNQRLYTGYNISSHYFLDYYIEMYISFLYFNYYYENSLNLSPVPVYSPDIAIKEMPHQISLLKTKVTFYVLNYNIGQFLSIEEWEKHYKNVQSTLDFLDTNNMSVIKQVENLKEDIKILNDFIRKFFEIKKKENCTMDDFKKFEDELYKIHIKNENYKNNIIYSIKGNIEYLSKYINAMREEYKNIEDRIKDISSLKDNFYNLQEENKKTKDFYLTVSGAVMALISIVSGNISMISKSIIIQHIFIFNGSILIAILIFSYLFNSIYNLKENTYPKKLIHCTFIILILIFSCLFYA